MNSEGKGKTRGENKERKRDYETDGGKKMGRGQKETNGIERVSM